MMRKLSMLFVIFFIGQLFVINAYGQFTKSDSPFEREFADIKFLDAYFGTFEQKVEVDAGDQNVPLTVVMANIGTQDITGIRGQLSLPSGFSPSDGKDALILADKDDNSLAGDVFSLTFFVNVDKNLDLGQYPGTIKVDYSRLRETGERNIFFNFDFKLTGDSTLSIKAIDPILTSIKNNPVVVEVSNLGTAPISNIDIVLQNTQTSISSTTQSVTNLENVVFDQNTWDIGTIEPKSSKHFSFNVYVPENLKDESLHLPVEITYYNAHGDTNTITKTIDFYINGLISATIYNVDVIELSKKQTVIGEILNEGNVDGLFAFVTLEPRGDSNIKKSTQYIDKLEPDSPVPFNIPIEFDGEPREGEHDVRITTKYKDSLRNENTITYDTTVFYKDTSKDESGLPDASLFIILGIVAVAGVFAYYRIKKRKKTPTQTS
ncbi:MAG TPA: hypothetical protein VLB45_07300 [Nitrosopumilaceae archaeon]|nr:hypothetical protein [Nitrosopumilaceae archaeon]